MLILSIHNKGELHKNGSKKNIVDDMIREKKHVFILIYMEGCGPCNATRPEWAKMADTLQKQYSKNKDIVIIDINKDLLSSIKGVGSINGFPTMKYITNKGHTVENYEDSSINDKRRELDCFMNWIESHVSKIEAVSNLKETHKRRTSYRNKRVRKPTHKRHIQGGRKYTRRRRRR